MFSSTGSAVIASSYLSEDEAMLGAEAQYCQMEAELKDKLDNFESYYPGYDEYNYDLDDIEHDPYVLVSILSALHEAEFTLDEIQSTLQMLFDKQYILTMEEIVEARYRNNRWGWGTSLQYVAGLHTVAAADRTEDFLLWNLTASYQLTEPLQLFVRGENLLAQRYEINAGFPLPRATVMGGFRVNF